MDNVLPASDWFSRNQDRLIRYSLGICYLWFGMLKFFPGMSPAETLAKATIAKLTFGLIPDNVNLLLLAIWEVAIGLIFFSGYFVRIGAKAAVVHLIFTFTPLFLLPEVSFAHFPYAFTLVGQYIVKNFLFLVALGILLKKE